MITLESVFVKGDSTIREVMTCLERNAKGIVLIVDDERHLIDTITDGDIRRAILSGLTTDQFINRLLNQRSPQHRPITALATASKTELIRLMNEYSIRHIPLLDSDQHVVDLALLSDMAKEYETHLTAVVMAGGFGTRLRPLTEDLPKPMLPIGDRPIMEHIITKLQMVGIRRVNITTHYKPEKITNYFGDGSAFGVNISYIPEDRPLGTAGSLRLMPAPDETLLIINGDILTEVNFMAMLDYHRENRADMTVAVRKYDMQVPYGVIECNGPVVHRINEKPKLNFLVNAGIYLLEPSMLKYISIGEKMDMTDLIQCLIKEGHTVVSFPVIEYWIDIGQHADYKRAQEDAQKGSCVF